MGKIKEYWKEILIGLLVLILVLSRVSNMWGIKKNLTDYDINVVDVEWEKDDELIIIEGYFENDDRADIIFIEYVVFLLDGGGRIISADKSISDGVKSGEEVYFDMLALNHKGVRGIRIQIVSVFEEWR